LSSPCWSWPAPRFQNLRAQLDAQLANWREISAKDVPALNDLMKKQGIQAIRVVPVRKEEEL
jgi:ABC-type Zn uptake system ZnuABC Zn-binding protein ZnuA